MTEEELRRLRSHYHALLGHERTLAAIPSKNVTEVVDEGLYRVIQTEIEQINKEFPGILAPFQRADFFSHDVGRGEWYRLHALKVYVGGAVGRLRGVIEDSNTTPVTQKRSFSYINDPTVRAIVVRDYDEVQRAYVAKCWKSVILLSGGSIEAILLDLLKQRQPAAKAAAAAPKEPNLDKWDLSDLIDVAVELKLVGPGIEKLSHSVRQYRNLIHPGVEVRSGLTFDQEEARIALEVLHILDRELTP